MRFALANDDRVITVHRGDGRMRNDVVLCLWPSMRAGAPSDRLNLSDGEAKDLLICLQDALDGDAPYISELKGGIG